MPAPFNVVGIDHIVLRAANPAALERFYLTVLGLSFEKRQSELAQLRAGNALIDIVPANEAGPAGGTSSTGGANLDHLCLRIQRSMRRRSPNIWQSIASPAVQRPCATVPRARARPFTCEIPRGTASNSRDRQLINSVSPIVICKLSERHGIAPYGLQLGKDLMAKGYLGICCHAAARS
jgi:Glyoxalase/Bleomycin resistance protein/Dioxygenase superfamily